MKEIGLSKTKLPTLLNPEPTNKGGGLSGTRDGPGGKEEEDAQR